MWTHTRAPVVGHLKGTITTQSPCAPFSRPAFKPLCTTRPIRLHTSLVTQALREDPWSTLGLSPSASEQQVKKAYRKLALKHHPDVDPSEAAHERFLAIQEAYELVTGKRRGKETDARHSSSWEFHDWYWSFKRSKAKRGGRHGAAGATSPPPASNLNQQLSGLKQRAHTRKATSRRQRFAGAAVSPPSQPSPQPSPATQRRVANTPASQQQQHVAASTSPAAATRQQQHHNTVAAAPPPHIDTSPPSIPRAPLHHVRVMLNTISDSHRCLARELHTVLVRRLEVVLHLSPAAADHHHHNNRHDHQGPAPPMHSAPGLDMLQGAFAEYSAHSAPRPPKGHSIAATEEGRQQVTAQLTGLRRKASLRRTASSVG